MMKQAALKTLQQIPGVGPKLAQAFCNIGLRAVRDLKDQDPKVLYQRLCDFEGGHVDRCVLYVFRCAVYYASDTDHDPDLLKWWNWKDD